MVRDLAKFGPGSILRIRLKDFLTYDYIDFDCGPVCFCVFAILFSKSDCYVLSCDVVVELRSGPEWKWEKFLGVCHLPWSSGKTGNIIPSP